MKQTLFLTLALSFVCTFSYGQLTKKTWLVGGSGSLYSYNEDYTTPNFSNKSKFTNIDLSASIGYFIINKFAGGLRPTFSSSKGETFGVGSTNSYRLAVGPFARYYFLKTDKGFNILTDISYQVGLLQQLGVLHEKGKYNTFSLMAGTEVFFNSAAGLEILLGYKNQVTTIENSPGAFNSNKNGIQVSIGFQLHLEKN